jgi:hypothetical protein
MGHFLTVGALLAASSTALAEIPANKAQNECATNAYNVYQSKLQQGITPQDSTIANIVAGRHLMEGYCLQFVHCLDYSASVQGTMFQSCLDDEDADRLHDARE